MNAIPKDGQELQGNARYVGYSMDLIAGIAKIIGFKFTFLLTSDNKNGNWDERTKRWTGVIGDLLERVSELFFFIILLIAVNKMILFGYLRLMMELWFRNYSSERFIYIPLSLMDCTEALD